MKYTTSHEWVKLQKEKGVVGISEFAQKELGEVVFVQLPKVGTLLEKGEEAAILESTKAAVDVYAPLSGEVVEVNEALRDKPSLINTSAEQDGWLFVLRLTQPEEEKELLHAKTYQEMLL
jgi:glycine cleavage system H protein